MNELTVTTGSSLIEAIHNGTPITVPERREIYLKYVKIAGWNYRDDIEAAFDELGPRTRLTLRREPTNEHDELAIKVLSPTTDQILLFQNFSKNSMTLLVLTALKAK